LFSGVQIMYSMPSKPVPLWVPLLPIMTLVSTYTG
jgi:hypothetical protein